jgi:hypothetical protein
MTRYLGRCLKCIGLLAVRNASFCVGEFGELRASGALPSARALALVLQSPSY